MAAIHIRSNRSEQRLAPYSTNHIKDIPKLREFLTGIKPRLLLRNIPKDLTQSEMIPMMPVQPSEIKAIEFLKRSDSTFSGACVVELGSFESLKKAIEIDGREVKGMVIWAVKDEDGIRTMSLLRNLGHKNRVEKPPEPVVTKPDENLIQNALKLASEIDLSQLSTLQKAIDNVNGTTSSAPQDDFKLRSVKVRNLPKAASTIRLQQIFNGCGTIENITAPNQKGEVIIRYATPDEADLAVRFYNGRKMDGKKLQVLYRDRY